MVLWGSVPLVLLGVAICLVQLGGDLGLLPSDWRSGIGDVKQARSKIKVGMTRDEVRSVLGRPHRDDGDEWRYWGDRLAYSILLVRFGDDDRVTESEWWLN